MVGDKNEEKEKAKFQINGICKYATSLSHVTRRKISL